MHVLLLALAFAADPDYAKELPRIPPTEPKDALKTFVLKPGYRLEQVAAEPLIASPVAVAWDENSRLYVVEMRGYSENRGEKLSRIKLLESTKGDGVYDKATVFADGLLWPTAVACWDGGVFVGDAPHVYYLKDTDGDGRADVKKVVFTGFGTHNVQGLLNTFLWTLDNRIHGSASTCGGTITKPDDPTFRPLNINGRDFDFDPRTLDLRATSGGGQHGMTFDDWGHKFVSSNSDHIQQVMYEDRYIARNPYLVPPPPRVSIATDGPQAEVFRISPVEPWRTLRTRLRVQGIAPGPIEGGGRASGYFTGATGVTICRGDAAPDLKGLAFVADVGSNLVHRKKLTLPAGGVQYRADRIDKDSEFLASTDVWFRPVQFANGPDGCLLVIDMYRETIEHPASLPPAIKKHLDLTSGRDRGRLYRIVPEGHTPRQLPKLGGLPTAELVKLLDHPNAWQRETASRLLYERQDKAAVELLHVRFKNGEWSPRVTPEGHVHRLYALQGLNALAGDDLQACLASDSPRVREHGVRLAAPFEDDRKVAELLDLHELGRDPQVHYQFLFTLGDRKREVEFDLEQTNADKWLRVAYLSSLTGRHTWTTLEASISRHYFGDAELPMLLEVVQMASRKDSTEVVEELMKLLRRYEVNDDPRLLSVVRAIHDGGGKKSQDAISNAVTITAVSRLVKIAATKTADDTLPVSDRLEAVRSLSLGQPADVRDTLVKLLDPKQPGEVQLAALGVLDQLDDPALVGALLKQWPTLSPRLRAAAGDALLSRPARVSALLDAIEAKAFAATRLDAMQVKRLTAHKDAAIRKRATTLLASFQPARRTEVVAMYRAALDAKGDAAKGKAIFAKSCAACHRLEGVGTELGPNLAAMKNRGAEAILTNVLDPNAEVNPQYLNYTAELADGRTVTGMIQAETATGVTFVRGEGLKDVVPRANIDTLTSSGLSLMPEGLEKDVTVEAMADLIAYLMAVP